RGAMDVIEGRAKTVAGIVVRDDHTVDIELEEPLAFFLSLLTMHEAAIVPSEEARDLERFRTKAIGAGAFKVEEAVEGQRVVLVRNRDYYVPGEPHLDRLEFRLDLPGFDNMLEAFLRGDIDVSHGVPLRNVNELRKDPRYAPYMLQTVQLHTSYFGWDCTRPPFDRVEVRQAVNYAINKHRINDEVFGGLSIVAESLLPPGLLGYEPSLRGFTYDPDRARQLMRQAGYTSGFTMEYRSWPSDVFRKQGIVERILEDLAAIGIRVNITEHPPEEARAPLQNPGHGNVFCGNWYADFPDSDNFFYVFFHSDSSSLRGFHYHTPTMDRQIEEARRTNDTEKRANIYRELDQMVLNEAPMVCLFHERMFVVHKPEVRGLKTSLVPPPVRYHDTWLERSGES